MQTYAAAGGAMRGKTGAVGSYAHHQAMQLTCKSET